MSATVLCVFAFAGVFTGLPCLFALGREYVAANAVAWFFGFGLGSVALYPVGAYAGRLVLEALFHFGIVLLEREIVFACRVVEIERRQYGILDVAERHYGFYQFHLYGHDARRNHVELFSRCAREVDYAAAAERPAVGYGYIHFVAVFLVADAQQCPERVCLVGACHAVAVVKRAVAGFLAVEIVGVVCGVACILRGGSG